MNGSVSPPPPSQPPQQPQLHEPSRVPSGAGQPDLLGKALELVANAIFITDASGHIIWANAAFSRLCGYEMQELIGNTPAMLRSGAQSEVFYEQLWQTITSGQSWRGVVVDRHKNGGLYKVDQTITPLVDERGAISHFIAIQQDITLREQDAEREHYLAFHDTLTSLPNRHCFIELLKQCIARAEQNHYAVAVLFLDLDKFKPVNDRHGHDTGDQLLQAVAKRLGAAIRKTDTAARIGGDEFAVLLPDLEGHEVPAVIAPKLVAAMAQPFMIARQKFQVGASIGIALYPMDGDTVDDLLRKADQAMYAAKRDGGGDYRFYRDDVQAH